VGDFQESKSAYKQGREEFAKVIKMIQSGKADGVLVYHISRLARNMTDGGIIIDMLKDEILQEVRTPSEIYAKNSGQEFFLALQFAMSKKSSDDTSEFVRRDLQAKILKGEYPGFVPLGYLNMDKDGKISGKQYKFEKQEALEKLNRTLRRIEVDPMMGPLVQELFEYCATGQYSLARLREITNGWGLVGERSKKMLSKITIYRLLSNPFYYGAILWKGTLIEPEELPDGKHEPIISRELYHKVQEELHGKRRPVMKKRYYTYTNFIKCGTCGGNISGMMAKGITYYRCTKCTGLSYIPESELEEQIIKTIKEMTIDEDFLKLALEEINKANEKEIGNRDLILKKQEVALKRCQAQLDNLVRLKISPDNSDGSLLGDEEFVGQKKEILLEKEKIQEKMGDVDDNCQSWFNLATDYVNFTYKLSEKFKTASPEERREVFQFIYYNPLLSNKRLMNSDSAPHNFIISFNTEKMATTTTENLLGKQKEGDLVPSCLLVRNGRDSNPRPPA
jgi:site-specific DNA recombinase